MGAKWSRYKTLQCSRILITLNNCRISSARLVTTAALALVHSLFNGLYLVGSDRCALAPPFGTHPGSQVSDFLVFQAMRERRHFVHALITGKALGRDAVQNHLDGVMRAVHGNDAITMQGRRYIGDPLAFDAVTSGTCGHVDTTSDFHITVRLRMRCRLCRLRGLAGLDDVAVF